MSVGSLNTTEIANNLSPQFGSVSTVSTVTAGTFVAAQNMYAAQSVYTQNLTATGRVSGQYVVSTPTQNTYVSGAFYVLTDDTVGSLNKLDLSVAANISIEIPNELVAPLVPYVREWDFVVTAAGSLGQGLFFSNTNPAISWAVQTTCNPQFAAGLNVARTYYNPAATTLTITTVDPGSNTYLNPGDHIKVKVQAAVVYVLIETRYDDGIFGGVSFDPLTLV